MSCYEHPRDELPSTGVQEQVKKALQDPNEKPTNAEQNGELK